MTLSKLRRQIAWEAARLMFSRQESEYFQAKQKAARRVVRGWVKPGDLPSNAEIREQVQMLARLHESGSQAQTLSRMRVRALWWLHQLAPFHPKLIGSVLTGGIREGSDIDVHVFCNHTDPVTEVVENLGFVCEVQRKRIVKDHEDLLLLGDCDRAGRVPGAVTDSLDEAIDYIQNLEELFGD